MPNGHFDSRRIPYIPPSQREPPPPIPQAPPPPIDYGPYYVPPQERGIEMPIPDQGELYEGRSPEPIGPTTWREWNQEREYFRRMAEELWAREQLKRQGNVTLPPTIPPEFPEIPPPSPASYTPMTPESLQRGWPSLSPSQERESPIERLKEWRYRELPSGWQDYVRVQGIEDPEEFWDWVQREHLGGSEIRESAWPIDPHWLKQARGATPLVWPQVYEKGMGGYSRHPGGRSITDRLRRVWTGAPFSYSEMMYGPRHMVMGAPLDVGGYRHELGHQMEREMLPGAPLEERQWEEAVRRWADDPGYESGKEMWEFISTWPPGATEENPGWGEAYAYAGSVPLDEIPPYIRMFLPWRYGATATMHSPQDLESARLRMTPIGPQW